MIIPSIIVHMILSVELVLNADSLANLGSLAEWAVYQGGAALTS